MGVQINGDTGNVIATKGTYSGNVTIGGTLTYEDVTNIDSVGIITARSGIEIGASPGVGASISVDGNAIFSGITTAATLKATTGIVTTLTATTGIVTSLIANTARATTGIVTTLTATTGIVTTFVTNTAKVGAAVTISESGIEATGVGITCANLNGGQFGRRNIVINGAMSVSQRSGTTETTVTHDQTTYSVDRFAIFDKIDGGNNFTYQQTTNPVPDGFKYALKINTAIADGTVDAGNYAYFWQVIEDKNIQQANLGTSAAKPLTLSFHVYSNKTGTYTVGLVNYGSYDRTFLKEFTISASGTWEKKTITFPAITSGTWENVRLQWCLVGGTDVQGAADTLLTSTRLATSNQVNFASTVNNSFHITGVQLEVGSQATAFEHRSMSEEFTDCFRYYRLQSKSRASGRLGGSVNYVAMVSFPLSPPMRSTPTVAMYGSANYNSNVSSIGTVNIGSDHVGFTANISDGNYYYYNNGWTADAEL